MSIIELPDIELLIKIPKNFMNCGVTLDNHFIADTNDSTEWDTLKFPLPTGEWRIKRVINKRVKLIRVK